MALEQTNKSWEITINTSLCNPQVMNNSDTQKLIFIQVRRQTKYMYNRGENNLVSQLLGIFDNGKYYKRFIPKYHKKTTIDFTSHSKPLPSSKRKDPITLYFPVFIKKTEGPPLQYF